MNEFKAEKLLNALQLGDILDKDELLEYLQMAERNKFLAKHKYSMWKGNDNLWYTHVYIKGKRKLLKRKTKESLESAIVSIIKESEENPTVEDIYIDWITGRLQRNAIIEATYTRYNTDFYRCLGVFGKMKIKNVTPMDIEDCIISCIQEKNMSRKAYSNLRTLFYGIFKKAKKMHLTDIDIKSVIEDIDFCSNDFKVVLHEDASEVFMIGEEKVTLEYLTEHPNLINLGLLLLFKTGMRVGELAALKKEDIGADYINVCRTETKYKDRSTGEIRYEVKDSPKTLAGNRTIYLKKDYIWILKKIRELCPFGEYVFMEDGQRIRSYKFRYHLYRICNKLNVIQKGPHKIRKTYGSILYDSEIPKALIADQMGHSDISCLERHYYYNRLEDNRKRDAINNVVNL